MIYLFFSEQEEGGGVADLLGLCNTYWWTVPDFKENNFGFENFMDTSCS